MELESIDLLPIGLVASAILLVLASFVDGGARRGLKALGIAALLSAMAALAWNMKHSVRPGTVGVQVLSGKTQPEALAPGPHYVHPQSHFHEMVTRQQALEFTGALAFRQKDRTGKTVTIEMAVPFRLSDAAAPYVYEEIGPDDVYIRRLKQTARAAVTATIASKSIADLSPEALDQLAMDLEGNIRLRVAEGLIASGFTQPQALTVFEFGRPEILNICTGSCPAKSPAPLAPDPDPT